MRPPASRIWLLQLGIAVLWVVTWQFGRLLAYTEHASLWFPPAGLTFAAFLVFGRRAWLPVMLGAVVTTFESAAAYSDPRSFAELLGSGVAFGGVHALCYGTGAWLYDRLYGEARLGTPAGVIGFLLMATLASALAALGGIGSLAWTGAAHMDLRTNLVPWWVGDLVAVVTLGPAFVLAADEVGRRMGLRAGGWWQRMRQLAPRVSLGRYLLKLGASIALALALGALLGVPEWHLPVALVVYALIVPLMWITHTEGPVRSVIAMASLAVAVVLMTRLFGSTEQAFNYQAAMITIGGTGLFTLSVPALYADNVRLRDLATYDQLTGARTRAVFLEAGADEVERAARYGRPVAVVELDVDNFKSVNDTFGHGAGDRVLARLGEVCRAGLRHIDLFGRIGGEEFGILLPTASLDDARQAAERLRQAIERVDWRLDAGTRPVTASFGVASLGSLESLEQGMARADAALYEAKRSGRNRVCVA